jgi:hypothetical protein
MHGLYFWRLRAQGLGGNARASPTWKGAYQAENCIFPSRARIQVLGSGDFVLGKRNSRKSGGRLQLENVR